MAINASMDAMQLILAQFPGKVLIPLVDAGAAIGYAEQTCYNLHHKGKFPLPVRKQGRKPVVALTDLVNYLTNGKDATSPAPSNKPRRGRPRNSELYSKFSSA